MQLYAMQCFSQVIYFIPFWCVGFSINYSNFIVPIVLSIASILSSYTLSLSHNETTNQLYSELSIYQPAYSGVAWKDFESSEGCKKIMFI
jgi:hypothetical protein